MVGAVVGAVVVVVVVVAVVGRSFLGLSVRLSIWEGCLVSLRTVLSLPFALS